MKQRGEVVEKRMSFADRRFIKSNTRNKKRKNRKQPKTESTPSVVESDVTYKGLKPFAGTGTKKLLLKNFFLFSSKFVKYMIEILLNN